MGIEVQPKSLTIQLTITNRSAEKRYLVIPLDLTHFRIRLTDEQGRPLKMTVRGVEDLTEPAAGSVTGVELNRDQPWSTSIDLGRLFEFPEKGVIRCEVRRVVNFTEPLKKKPSEKEWMTFPPVNIVIDADSPAATDRKNKGNANPPDGKK